MRRANHVGLLIAWISLIAVVGVTAPALAQARRAIAGPGTVNLPYRVVDNAGNNWMIYQNGYLRMEGNMPLYSQAAMLQINNNSIQSSGNRGQIDDGTGELILDGLQCAGTTVTRRILVNRQDGYVRYIDLIRNPTAQEVSINVQLITNFNYGVQSSQLVHDPRNKNIPIGIAAMLHANRAIVEVYGGKGSKVVPSITAPQNNNQVQASMQLTIPANKQVGLMHLHGTGATQEAAAQWVTSLKDSQVLSDLPLEIRKLIINVTATQSIGDREVLRGELLDVVELRGGDQLKGTIAEQNYKLETFYGPIELPAERVVGLINVGQFKPRQLLVTLDGEVFGGALSKETIGIQLSSGQTTQVPLSQISRFGYRKRSNEPEEWTFEKPMIALRSGERMMFAMPANPIDVMTRYGLLNLAPQGIAVIMFQSEDHGVHDVRLTDGSRFAGLVSADRFDLQLVGTASQQQVSFPASAVLGIQFVRSEETDTSSDDAAVLDLTNQDQLVGALSGQLKLDTHFDTITVDAAELRALTRAADAGGFDVQVTLWDQTTLSGQLREPEVTCNLRSGISVKVPVPLIDNYSNPLPRPSPMMLERIKGVVAQLSADDWKQREQAEAQLVQMGTVVIGVLKELSGTQPPEAQQRIDSVLKQLEKKDSDGPAGGAGAVAPAVIFTE